MFLHTYKLTTGRERSSRKCIKCKRVVVGERTRQQARQARQAGRLAGRQAGMSYPQIAVHRGFLVAARKLVQTNQAIW